MEHSVGHTNSLTRSDTLPLIEPPIWSNTRPPAGPTPIPPRNEPILYIPSNDLPPKLLKLQYLSGLKTPAESGATVFEGGESISLSDALGALDMSGTGMVSCCVSEISIYLSIGDSTPTTVTKSLAIDSEPHYK